MEVARLGVLALALVALTSCRTSEAGDGSRPPRKPPVGAVSAAGSKSDDQDNDGIRDDLEQTLAERYAPVVFYAADEPNLPQDVDTFLGRTQLWYYDSRCNPALRLLEGRAGPPIPRLLMQSCRAGEAESDSWNSRSDGRERTFFLANVDSPFRAGARETDHWTTYYHAYRNHLGGITIQYWRFYPYNTGFFWGVRSNAGSHGGDWEAVHVVLGPPPDFAPAELVLLGHRDISRKPFQQARTFGTHPLVLADKGGHTTILVDREPDEHAVIRHESWTGGRVRWPAGQTTPGAPLRNLGEKTAPAPGMEFLRYSGLWGARETTGMLPRLRSGYWGPAYNETGMGADGFVVAWCFGMTDRNRTVTEPGGAVIRECYASPAR